MQSYIDLDDTLADTSHYIQITFNYSHYAINASVFKKHLSLIKDAFVWNIIKKNPFFWNSLPKTRNADFIVKSAFNLAGKKWSNVHILTALPRLVYKKGSNEWKAAEKEKINWVKKYYPQIPLKNILVVYAKDKKNYANANSLLIDDSPRNVKAWKKSKGSAYFANNTNQINRVS